MILCASGAVELTGIGDYDDPFHASHIRRFKRAIFIMRADAALQIDAHLHQKQHIEVVILQRLFSLIAVKRLRLTAQMPAGHQQLNAFRFQQSISHVHTVGHRNYVSVLRIRRAISKVVVWNRGSPDDLAESTQRAAFATLRFIAVFQCAFYLPLMARLTASCYRRSTRHHRHAAIPCFSETPDRCGSSR